jgi:hypothetical protein
MTELSDEAIARGAAAVAAFADQHRLQIPPELREDLARDVLTAAGQQTAGETNCRPSSG